MIEIAAAIWARGAACEKIAKPRRPEDRLRISSRSLATCLCCVAVACWLSVGGFRALAQAADVPIALQVELLARLLWYERVLQKSTSKEVVVLVIERRDHPESKLASAQLSAQLDRIKQLGGKAVIHTRVAYESIEQIARIVAQRRPYLIYWSKALGSAAKDFARQHPSLALLTVAADSYDATHGAVLGFELASSKPRIVLSLEQARAQKLDFSAQVLRVVRVLP